jgi:hypothetical protein
MKKNTDELAKLYFFEEVSEKIKNNMIKRMQRA